eukprot:CAMPEP_0197665266 /NCGR_PEP_ID=MMETSP1338-20131121/59126_1 /TAXON_ID=43686 ORGANISM="Pelagodinium beii, Strain RCC1491" /NCGR_SAMPLE_ID=MMETSP1338 /ASSEMBLY_ACC=CAM_ASM_000754 /LENGTH=272 /DNA_ID=CAMNT_0043244043 /DNA_START=41 /DNA_END=856 /DNA_ORIENTATION=-
MDESLLPSPARRRALRQACSDPDCIKLLIALPFLLATLGVALSRNSGCDYDALKDIPPPHGGSLVPANITLVERRHLFQLYKYVDVFDRDGHSVGYFYDMNFLLWMRFGFSDSEHRIWFEAKYKSFLSRFKFNIEYYLQRCDVGADAREGGMYDVKEDWWARKWFCITNCVRKFSVSRTDVSNARDTMSAATAVFNSTLVHRGMLGLRHEWYLNMTDSLTSDRIAFAKQHFFWGGPLGNMLLSNWTVDVAEQKAYLPNWVIAFMAALDDVEE